MLAPILTRRITRRSLLATLGNLFLLGACGGGEIDKRIPLQSHFVPFGLCMSWDGRDGRSTWATTPHVFVGSNVETRRGKACSKPQLLSSSC